MPDIFIPDNKTEEVKKETRRDLSEVIPHHVRHFASFYEKPTGIFFKNQEADEKILLFLRRHFITNISWIFLSIVFLLLPFALFFLNLADTLPFLSSLPSQFIFAIAFLYYLIIFNYILVNFITWFFESSLVTQRRIVDIDFSDLVYHDVAVTKLSLVEDVNYTQTGFLRTFFNYGDAYVQTAGEQKHFDFLAIPNPGKAVHIIQDLIGKRREIHE
ncbi:hypothetical protein C4559_01280 [Candidatus Microgenomates bacterium]|nr:MAG: hypothetical protein C4559_01280 [Candidatus Microgenomates bacterium]